MARQVSEVDVKELATARADGALVVDVREPDEYVAGHVPGARLIPLGVLPARTAELPRGERVYVICASGARSYQAAQYLANAGYDAASVAGGTTAWRSAGNPVVTGAHQDAA